MDECRVTCTRRRPENAYGAIATQGARCARGVKVSFRNEIAKGDRKRREFYTEGREMRVCRCCAVVRQLGAFGLIAAYQINVRKRLEHQLDLQLNFQRLHGKPWRYASLIDYIGPE